MGTGRQPTGREMVQILKDAFVDASMSNQSTTPQQRRQQALLRMLQTGDAPVQWVAIKELGQIGDLAAADAIMPFTSSPNRELEGAAKAAYRQIQDREVTALRPTAPPPPPATRATTPPPPPPPAAVVTAQMGRSRDTRMTKGQDLPVPPTEMELGAMGAQAETAQVLATTPVVIAQMGRSRDTRMTKGQDLPVPLTETQLGKLKPQAELAALSLGAALGDLPVPAGIPEPVSAMAAPAPPSLLQPDIPEPAAVFGSVIDYSVLGINR